MTRPRDYHAEGERENQLARGRGFRNRAQQRRFERRPRTKSDLGSLPISAFEIRSDVAQVIDEAKARRLAVEVVAAEKRVPMSAVSWWGAEALEPTRGGKTMVGRRDILRLRPVVFEDGTELVTVRGWRRREADRVFDIQWRALSGRASEGELAWLRGRSFEGKPVVSDKARLVELARRGEIDPREASSRLHS